MPKLDISIWKSYSGNISSLTGTSNGPHSELPLGTQAGLQQFGVHLETLAPGSSSSFRHWHETEDEFVYILSGELILIEDEEFLLQAGDAAAWKAGTPIGHCLENRSPAPATFLVVGGLSSKGVVHYPDHDIVMHHAGEAKRFVRGDGTPIELKPSY